MRLPRLSLRTKGLVLLAMGAYLMAAPILDARRDLAATAPPIDSPEVVLACYNDPALDAASDRLRMYLDARDPVIDNMLPPGEGGTRYFQTLGDVSGLTLQARAMIAISLESGVDARAGEVEVHERAHLVQAALAREVADLMRGMPEPAREAYAATNAGEHFAEMAARAWSVLELMRPKDFCVEGDPIDWLRAAELEVPGTAGFLVWFLDQPALARVEGREPLRTEAARLMAPRQREWSAIALALESRRRPDGTFAPWPRLSVRESLDAQLWDARMTGGLGGRLRAAQILGGLALLRIFEPRAD